MNRIIQLVGISATGKSYFLNNCSRGRLSHKVNYIEFGSELRKLLVQKDVCLNNGGIPREYVIQLLDDIIKNKQPAIFTSHVVHYGKKGFSYDLEIEAHTNSAGFIYIYSDAKDVLERRIRDNISASKNRSIENLAIIKQHEKLCREITEELARKTGSRFLNIYNKNGLESSNIELIEGFIEEVLGI